MHKVVRKLISKVAMMQNIISFYFWNQKLCFKTESYFNQILQKDNFKPPLLLTSSLTTTLMMLKFWDNILHLLK
jgi:uncharacterized protein involved in tolerance to divalent cations